MRNALLSAVGWLGVLQSWTGPDLTLEATARLVGIAGVLGTLTVLIYRLGVWRQDLENTKNTVATEVKAHRAETASNFARLDRRLDSITRFVARQKR